MALSGFDRLRKPLRKSIGLTSPLKRSSKDAVSTSETTIEAVRDDLKNLIVTNHGERLVHYDFGANLRPLIFEQIDANTEQKIQDAISAAVERWMPFVTILEMNVFTSAEDNTVGDNEIRIKIQFSVGSTDIAGEVEVRVAS